MTNTRISEISVLVAGGILLVSLFAGAGCVHAYENPDEEAVLIRPEGISDEVKLLLVGLQGEGADLDIVLVDPRTGAPARLCELRPEGGEETKQTTPGEEQYPELPPCVASGPVQVKGLVDASVLLHEGSNCRLKRKGPPPYGEAVYEEVCN